MKLKNVFFNLVVLILVSVIVFVIGSLYGGVVILGLQDGNLQDANVLLFSCIIGITTGILAVLTFWAFLFLVWVIRNYK